MSSSTIDGPTDHVRRSSRRLIPTLRAVAFWLAIALPILQISWLIVGLDGVSDLLVFVGLLLVNGLSLALGHTYGHAGDAPRPDANP